MPLKPVWFYKGLLQLFTYWSWWQTSTNFDMKHECADAHPKHITICWHIIFPCLCCNDIPTFSELCIMTPSLLLLPAFSSFYSYISLWSLVYFVFCFFFIPPSCSWPVFFQLPLSAIFTDGDPLPYHIFPCLHSWLQICGYALITSVSKPPFPRFCDLVMKSPEQLWTPHMH